MEFPTFKSKAETFVLRPNQKHTQTFILLHGRGDRADSFGTGILRTYLPDNTTLRSMFPNAKFVFLQAPLRELASWPGTHYYQWFDVWNLKPGSEEHDLQVSGLKETINLVHGTLNQEIELVGAENVVLGGLSQGCASSLCSLLLWNGPPLAACIGMSGWLPFRKVLEESVFKSAGEHKSETAMATKQAISAFAKKFGYADSFSPPLVFRDVPVFIGHGSADDVVVPRLGQEAAMCINTLGAKVTYKDYDHLDHWYSPVMLQDIVRFLHAETNWEAVSKSSERGTTAG